MVPPPQVVLTAETGQTIKILLWNWHINNLTSRHDKLPLHQRKENNFLKINVILIFRLNLQREI